MKWQNNICSILGFSGFLEYRVCRIGSYLRESATFTGMGKGTSPLDAGAKPSIHISQQDADNAEELGWEQKSPSTVYTDALEMAKKWKRIQEEKKEEIARKREELRDEEQKYGLN